MLEAIYMIIHDFQAFNMIV